MDVHIRRLRQALNGPGEADLIRTVRAAGYALEIPRDHAGFLGQFARRRLQGGFARLDMAPRKPPQAPVGRLAPADQQNAPVAQDHGDRAQFGKAGHRRQPAEQPRISTA